MSYLVLARKYRPRTFAEIAGQEVSTSVLEGAISENRVGHAYLFSGPRGTGKTTTARVFAKALNCETGPTLTPCGTCERCLAADSGNDVDIVEIDAASNTGVDNVRALRDQVAYMPLKARFKIYIIDEVHMLSKPAFNALLKTLEEPPAHVKFFFATTEPHKVIDTVLSRCQVLSLSPISESVITSRLDEVFAAENVESEAGVTSEIARMARGGMRDALSIADQLLALVGAAPKLEDLDRLRNESSSSGIEDLMQVLLAGDGAQLLSALPSTEGGEDELVDGLLGHLRSVLIAAMCREDSPLLEGVQTKGLAARAKQIGAGRIELWLEELLAARERMRLVPNQSRLILELCLLDLCREEITMPLDELVARLEQLEQRVGSAPSGPRTPSPASAPAEPQRTAPPAPEPVRRAEPVARPEPTRSELGDRPEPSAEEIHGEAPPTPQPPQDVVTPQRPRRVDSIATRSAGRSSNDAWRGFIEALSERAPSLATVLKTKGKLLEFGDSKALIQLSNMRDQDRLLMEDKRNRSTCAKIFSEIVGREIELDLQDSSGARRGSQDPFTKHVADLFGGRIEDES